MMIPRSEDETWVAPQSLEEWKNGKLSAKLDVLAEIVAYHLQKDGALPLEVLDDGITVSPTDSSPTPTHPSTSKEADRIIIFSAFPSSNYAILDVSSNSFYVSPHRQYNLYE